MTTYYAKKTISKRRSPSSRLFHEKRFRRIGILKLIKIVAAMCRVAKRSKDLLAQQPLRALEAGYCIIPLSGLTPEALDSNSLINAEAVKQSLLDYAAHPLPDSDGRQKKISGMQSGFSVEGFTLTDRKVLGIRVAQRGRLSIQELLVHEATHALNQDTDFLVFPSLDKSKNDCWRQFYDEFYEFLAGKIFLGKSCSFDSLVELSDTILKGYSIDLSLDEVTYVLRSYPLYIEFLLPGVSAPEALAYLKHSSPSLWNDFSVVSIHQGKLAELKEPMLSAYMGKRRSAEVKKAAVAEVAPEAPPYRNAISLRAFA